MQLKFPALIFIICLAFILVGEAAPPPHLTRMAPSSPVAATGNQVIIVTGSRFVSPIVTKIDTVTTGTASSITPTQFTWTVALTTTGAHTLTVTSGGKTSNGLAFTVISSTPPPPLVLTCPANKTATSSDGSAQPVTYTMPTSTGGVIPVTIISAPASGSLFPVGVTTVTATAKDSAVPQQIAYCSFTVTVTYSTPVTGRGPQASITCPGSAVNISPGVNNIQAVVNANPGATTFCLLAGAQFSITSAITPKTGNTFIGQFGAIIDGSGWTSADTTQGAFRAHNQDIDNVTIKNLIIRNMPQGGIHAFKDFSDTWDVENNEIGPVGGTALVVPNNFTAKNNYIHNATIGCYANSSTITTGLFNNNEVSYCGNESKWTLTTGVTTTGNYFHNSINGIWYDGDNTNCLIDNNTVTDNSAAAIFVEISQGCVVTNNMIQRNGDQAVFVSNSNGLTISTNTLEDNFRGITYFIDCQRTIDEGPTHDTKNNASSNNVVRIGTQSGALGNILGWTRCTAAQLADYTGVTKALTFQSNQYSAPNITGGWFLWGAGLINFTQWQGVPQDSMGSIQIR